MRIIRGVSPDRFPDKGMPRKHGHVPDWRMIHGGNCGAPEHKRRRRSSAIIFSQATRETRGKENNGNPPAFRALRDAAGAPPRPPCR